MNGSYRRILMLAGVAAVVASSCGDDAVSEGSGNQLEIQYEIASSCVAPGGTQSVTARTSPNANVAFAVVYSDGRFHGETPKGEADGKGVFKGTWKVPADAPPGNVEVRILVARSNQTGTSSVPFLLAANGTNCSDALAAAAAATSTTVRAGATTTSPSTSAPSGSNSTIPASTSTTTSTIPKGNFKSTITVSKSCVNAGDIQSFVVKTAPNSPVTVLTRYADNDTHGDNTGGISGSDGKFSGTFVVDPAAPKGEAYMLATTDSRTEGVSFADTTFTVGC